MRFDIDEHGAGFSEPVPAALPREVALGPRLRLPGRDHLLFRAAPLVWADAGWAQRCPWARESWPAESPALIWPDDRAWTIVSEIDWDSTIVAGPAPLITAICADPLLEAMPIAAGSELHWDADTVNPRPGV